LQLAVQGKLTGGAVPKEVPLGSLARLQNGYAFKSEWFAKSGIRLLRNANVGHGKLTWDDAVHLSSKRQQEFERFKLSAGDVVLSLDRPLIATGLKLAVVGEGGGRVALVLRATGGARGPSLPGVAFRDQAIRCAGRRRPHPCPRRLAATRSPERQDSVLLRKFIRDRKPQSS
jgi:hypothetical protein